MQSIILAIDSFREKHSILVVGREDDAVTFKSGKILRGCQTGCYSERAHPNIIDILCVINQANSWVFEAEGFIVICRLNRRAIFNLKVDTVFAACHPQM